MAAMVGPDAPEISESSPPRAFTQGVGTVFQFVGGTLFVASMLVGCASSFLGKDVAMRTSLTTVGWHSYSAQRATTVCMMAAVFFGLALAGIGLGLQAQSRRSPPLAVIAT